MEEAIHRSVMPEETLKFLKVKKNGIYVDCTFGNGGHSKMILEKINDGKLVAFEWDPKTLRKFAANFKSDNFITINDNFANLGVRLEEKGIHEVDGFLFDLGISSYQLDNEERGFSYRKNSPLDMRINQNEECLLKAFEIVNYYSFKDLSNIIFDNGEEKKSRLIAKKICEKRKKKKIENTQELVKIIASCFKTKGKKHPAKKTFQALRIFINKELKNLAEALEQSLKKVKKGGRIIVISFHSLEDRIVKKFFKNCEKEGGFRNITKKPIVPNSKEIEDNNRARSAKMRVLERVS